MEFHTELDGDLFMARISKIISGGQSGGDLAGNYFAIKYEIETEINAELNYKPIYDEVPKSIRINTVSNKEGKKGGWIERTKYNINNSDFTIILVDKPIELTRGSKLTLNYCIKTEKPCIYINIYNRIGGYPRLRKNIGSLNEAKKIVELQEFVYKRPLVINIAGPRHMDRIDCIKFLEKLLIEKE